jgi:ComF family protein
MHGFKYRSHKETGRYLGRLMGRSFLESPKYMADGLIPLPLYPKKERLRGFNQSAILCEGINSVTGIPLWNDCIIRSSFTETQTRKNRVERWQNMDGRFFLTNQEHLAGRHVILVDDVVTTGATLESCGRELMKVPGIRLSIATLCFSSH